VVTGLSDSKVSSKGGPSRPNSPATGALIQRIKMLSSADSFAGLVNSCVVGYVDKWCHRVSILDGRNTISDT
jgi:hypothetical protein